MRGSALWPPSTILGKSRRIGCGRCVRGELRKGSVGRRPDRGAPGEPSGALSLFDENRGGREKAVGEVVLLCRKAAGEGAWPNEFRGPDGGPNGPPRGLKSGSALNESPRPKPAPGPPPRPPPRKDPPKVPRPLDANSPPNPPLEPKSPLEADAAPRGPAGGPTEGLVEAAGPVGGAEGFRDPRIPPGPAGGTRVGGASWPRLGSVGVFT